MTMRIVWCGWIAAMAAGCIEEIDGEGGGGGQGGGWTGTEVAYVCSDPSGVRYDYNGGGCATTQCNSTAHPMVVGCYYDFSDTPAWELPGFDANVIEPLCESACTDLVIEEAAELGRNYISDQCGPSFPSAIGTGLHNCPQMMMQDPDAPVTVSFTAAGSPTPVRASGTVAYGLGAVDAAGGRTATLLAASLAAPFTFTTATSNATVLLGYPSGTTVTVHGVSIDPMSLPVTSSGAGTIRPGGLWFRAEVTLTEPNGTPTTMTLGAANPWSLQVVATERSFRIVGFTDPFRGLFRF